MGGLGGGGDGGGGRWWGSGCDRIEPAAPTLWAGTSSRPAAPLQHQCYR